MSRRVRVLVRLPSAQVVDALRRNTGEPVTPTTLASQHGGVVQRLRDLGVQVEVLPALEGHPDAVFIEDQAVIADGVALIANAGHPSRRGEAASVAEVLGKTHRIRIMIPPATLDGGDVLRVGRTFFVGLGTRTNIEGAEAVRTAFAPAGFEVVTVEVGGELHLKCHASPLDERTVLASESLPALDTIRQRAEVLLVPEAEAYAANVIAFGRDVLLPRGYPRTLALLEAAGWRPHPLPMDQFALIDGSMTCLHLRT